MLGRKRNSTLAQDANPRARAMTFQILRGASFELDQEVYENALLLNVVCTSQLKHRKEAKFDNDRCLRFMSGACANDEDKRPSWKGALDQMCSAHSIYGACLWPTHPSNLTKKCVEEGSTSSVLPPVWTHQSDGQALNVFSPFSMTSFSRRMALHGMGSILLPWSAQGRCVMTFARICSLLKEGRVHALRRYLCM